MPYILYDTGPTNRSGFYYNSGVALCLFHLLKITDCHFENFIAHQYHPVLIDGETLFQPNVKLSEKGVGTGIINRTFLQSCLRTGFLPSWQPHDGNRSVSDISGMGGPRHGKMRSDEDDLHPGDHPVHNRPAGCDAPSQGDIDDIIAGFEALFGFIRQRKTEFLDQLYINGSTDFQVRYVYRATEIYEQVLRYALQPKHLKNGRMFSICLELIARSHLKNTEFEAARNILEAELTALHRLDIPVFYASTDSKDLICETGKRVPFFETSGLASVRAGISSMSTENLAYEKNIIAGVVSAASASTCSIHTETNPSVTSPDGKSEPTQHSYQNIAVRLAHEILQDRLRADGKPDWLSFAFDPLSGRYQFGPMGFSLYDGRAGLAVFFAALFRATGDDTYQYHAMEALQPVQLLLEKATDRELFEWVERYGLGGIAGFGSLIYGLLKTGEFLGSPELTEIAATSALRVSDEWHQNDPFLDMMSGNAGWIVVLQRLHAKTEDVRFLDKALHAGHHLVTRLSEKYFTKNDHVHLEPLLTGFSHGAAGMAFSLLTLNSFHADQMFQNMGKKLISYEQDVFFKTGSYADHRNGDVPASATIPNAWCHGASGIAQARTLVHPLTKGHDSLAEEISRIFSDPDLWSLKDVDHLCCGNLGRVDALLTGSLELNWPDLKERANQLAKAVRQRYEQEGRFTLNASLPDAFQNKGFFQGLPGIGYQILRLSDPGTFPSVLMLE